MERHQHAMVKFLSHLGQVWVYASHKPELLTTSLMVSVGNVCPTFGDETISIASYCFQKISRVNIEQQECCVSFCDFSGFIWTFLYINWVFNEFMCIIQIWTTCTCSCAYKLVEKSNILSLVACLGPMQEMGMNVKHPATVTRPQTLRYLVFKF